MAYQKEADVIISQFNLEKQFLMPNQLKIH